MLIISVQLFGNEIATRVFGTLSHHDLQLKQCDFEPDASAVVIFDEGVTNISKFDDKFVYIFERKVRVKIFTEAGVHWSEVEIPYYNSSSVSERVYEVKARSYNYENNKPVVTELDMNNVHTEISENWRRVKFAIPNTRVGSVIEYTYRIESDYLFNIPDWEFQWKIPVLNSRYTIAMIPFYEYQFKLQGSKTLDEFSSKVSDGLERSYFGINFKDMIYTFGMKNVPSFKDEAFITSTSDYISKIDFQLSKINFPNGTTREVLSTWPALINELSDDVNFGKFRMTAQKQASKIISINDLLPLSQQQRFDSVLNFVKQNFQWNEKYGLYAQQKFKELLATRKGNSSELNLLAAGLLTAAGIEAWPIIISNRDHGKIRSSYPFLNAFNNTILLAKVEGREVLCDATHELLPNDHLPLNCLNDVGLLISKGTETWKPVIATNISKTKTIIQSKWVGGRFESDIKTVFSDYDALFMQQRFGDDRSLVLEHIEKENDQVYDSTLRITSMQRANSGYMLSYRVSNPATSAGESLYIQPFLQEAPSGNLFEAPQRTYPVDLMYPYMRSYNCIMAIPEGYQVDYLPRNSRISTDVYEMDYSATNQNDTLIVVLTFLLKKAVYRPDEYTKLREFYGRIVEKAAEKVVLKRIVVE
jgi:hypothetical protein